MIKLNSRVLFLMAELFNPKISLTNWQCYHNFETNVDYDLKLLVTFLIFYFHF